MTPKQLKIILQNAIENDNEEELINYLGFENSGKIDSDHYDLIEKALLGTWHQQHEDLVNTIYLENLIDDRFVEPILQIAVDKDTYRLFDFDLEPTLRKCVHALKTINSKKSHKALEKLKSLKNENMQYALEMYK
ncbi:MAG: hypothetical protein WBP45_00925 [Daejeonella sp.]